MGKNKSNSKTYALVHRPHDDPLYGNPNVSQYVLMRVWKQRRDRKQQQEEDPFDYSCNNKFETDTTGELEYDRREFELGEYNLDLKNYDYTQHLKEVHPVSEDLSHIELEKQVSSELYEIICQVKSKTGQYIGVDMAARELEARKQLEEDRKRNKEVEKVLELLEKETWSAEETTVDEVSDNDDLEDDFVLMARGEQVAEQENLETDCINNINAKRDKQRQLLEEKFDHFYASLYDSDDQLSHSTDAPEWLNMENSLQFTTERIEKLTKELAGCSLEDSTSDKEMAKTYQDDGGDSQSESLEEDSLEETKTTFGSQHTSDMSNGTNNIPHLIGEDFHQEHKKRFGSSVSTPKDDMEKTVLEPIIITYRNKNETREEKRTRKKAVKEWKAFRRAEKSEWKKLFRQERQRQAKQIACSGTGRVFLDTVNG